jgi:hypothetical protein
MLEEGAAMNALFAAVIMTFALNTYAATPVPVPVPATPQDVVVTNPATNPVKMIDAFPRIPIKKRISDLENYTVPDGNRLVLETATLLVTCDNGGTAATARLDILLINGESFFGLSVPLVPTTLTAFTGTISARIVLEPGEGVLVRGRCTAESATSLDAFVFGYLISVKSPSLAP